REIDHFHLSGGSRARPFGDAPRAAVLRNNGRDRVRHEASRLQPVCAVRQGHCEDAFISLVLARVDRLRSKRRRTPVSRASAASPPAPQTKNAALTLERSATAPISGAAIGKQPPWISVKRLMTRPRSSSDERSWSDV